MNARAKKRATARVYSGLGDRNELRSTNETDVIAPEGRLHARLFPLRNFRDDFLGRNPPRPHKMGTKKLMQGSFGNSRIPRLKESVNILVRKMNNRRKKLLVFTIKLKTTVKGRHNVTPCTPVEEKDHLFSIALALLRINHD
jgi:hypothetical protein